MRIRSICVAIALVAGRLFGHQGFAQGLKNFFLMGHDNDPGLPLGGTDMDFRSVTPDIYYQYRDIGYSRANANISGTNCILLFSINGAWLADASGATIRNGTGSRPSFHTSLYPEGLRIRQTALIIPVPDAEDQSLMFHSTIDDRTGQFTRFLYFTEVYLPARGECVPWYADRNKPSYRFLARFGGTIARCIAKMKIAVGRSGPSNCSSILPSN